MIMTHASIEKLDYTEEPKVDSPPNTYWWIILIRCDIKSII